MAFGLSWWHWFFLAQPFDLPERLIGADPDYFYWRRHGPQPPVYWTPEAFEDYRRGFTDPETIHAMCEDYRAGASYDYVLDEADRGRNRIACPVLVLWGRRGGLGELYDVLSVWLEWANDLQARALDCGHHLAEEAPEETYAELFAFFSG
jgi:haloacetate dehalogenase